MSLKNEAVPMPEQDPSERIKNFREVPKGYSETQARREAARCLQCDPAPCVDGCPVKINIPKFIERIKNGRFQPAIDTIREDNNLPAICGRICPQEDQCQKVCTLGKNFEPVEIGRLERFAADWERKEGSAKIFSPRRTQKGRVAIVGSGPAGLTAAYDLRKRGYEVKVFEQFHRPGGVLVYGIPEFRLPNDIVEGEVSKLKKMGVKIKTNTVVGRLFTVDDLLAGNKIESYEAVFLGTGAGLPYFPKLPGENLNGIYSANEFLTRVNLMKAFKFPEYDTPVKVGERVATIGGGNVAMDAARTALRLGAEDSIIIYRRSKEQAPAREEEIAHAREEGIDFRFLSNPTRFIGNDGRVKTVECVRTELGEPDSSGRPRPVPIEGSEFEIPVDNVIIAIGTSPNPLIIKTTEGLESGDWGTIETNATGRTSKRAVWAGGDIVTGSATVIGAMGAGRAAAADIDRWLNRPTGSRNWKS